MQVQRVLDPQQVVLDRDRDRLEQGAVVATQATARVRKFGLGRLAAAEPEHLADFADAASVAALVGDEIQQLLGQLDRRVLPERGVATIGEALDFPLHLGQCLLERIAHRKGIATQRIERAGSHPEQAARGFGRGDRDQLLADVGQVADGAGAVVVLEPAQQCALVQAPQRLGATGQLTELERRGRAAGRFGKGTRQVGREQHALVERLLAARGAQLVEQGQQHDRDVAVAALQALEVIGKLHDALHEHRIGVITLGHLAVDQCAAELLHFLGDQGGAVQLHHAQGALDLVQQVRAGAQLRWALAFLDIALQGIARLLQRLVELWLDPGEGGEIDAFFLQPHAACPCLPGRAQGGPVVVA